MAIEFNCPYCTSTIRVKDNASGKRGKCPRCEQQLLVPTIEPPPQVQPASPIQPATESVTATPAAPPPTSEAALPDFGVNVAVPPDMPPNVVDPIVGPEPLVVAPPTATTSKYATRNGRRRRNANGPIVLGILGVCFVIIVGLFGYLWWKNQPLVLEGALSGDRVPSTSLRPATVSASDVSDEIKQSALTGLRELPYSLQSKIVVTEFRGTGSGKVEVRLVPTTTTSIVRVDPASDKTLAKWLEQTKDRLAAKRTGDVKEASQRFFEAYADHTSSGSSMGDASYYRNQLALGAMNPTLGYFVEAVAQLQACPCVYEDSAGNLYFAVPSGTREFKIRGRTLVDGKKLFTGNYTVDCSATPEAIEVVKPETKAEPDSKDAPASDSTPDKKATEMSEPKPSESKPMEKAKPMDSGGMFEPEGMPAKKMSDMKSGS